LLDYRSWRPISDFSALINVHVRIVAAEKRIRLAISRSDTEDNAPMRRGYLSCNDTEEISACRLLRISITTSIIHQPTALI
jgi:hypothetical protein